MKHKIGLILQTALFIGLLVISVISAFADHYDRATYYLVLLIFLVVMDEKVKV